jgi:hypothetical protein
MTKHLIILSVLLTTLLDFAWGQSGQSLPSDTSVSAISRTDSLAYPDSLLKEIRTLIDDLDMRQSFFSVSMGVGNRLYSLRNDNINSQQASLNQFALTPMMNYTHRTGLGITAMAYIKGGDGKLTPYQYALSPSYDRLGRGRFAYGISYTHYFTRDDLDFYATPLKDEVYGYASYRKGWLEPGLSVGWAGGSYRDVRTLDTVILGIRRHIVDTTTVSLNDITALASLSHSFDWDDLLKKGDGLSLEPRFSLIAGSTAFDQRSRFDIFSGRNLQRLKVRNRSVAGNSGFQFQSVAFSLSATYMIGKWSFTPSYYISYYLQASEKPFTNLFSLTAMVLF